jgi:hypothetical protein
MQQYQYQYYQYQYQPIPYGIGIGGIGIVPSLSHTQTKIYQIWDASFQKTTAIERKLIVGTCNNPNLTNELVRRSPRLGKHEKHGNSRNNNNIYPIR